MCEDARSQSHSASERYILLMETIPFHTSATPTIFPNRILNDTLPRPKCLLNITQAANVYTIVTTGLSLPIHISLSVVAYYSHLQNNIYNHR